jgi:hypothetical protein
MLEAPDDHAGRNYQYVLTGDESWMMYNQMPSKIWMLDRYHLDGMSLVKILPEGQKVTSENFKDQILHAVYRISLGGWRLGRRTHFRLPFDSAPVHKAKEGSERLTEYRFFRFTHSPCSPDLSPYDVFPFGYLREQLKDAGSSTHNELEIVIVQTIEAIPRTVLSDILQS